jgi:hypothetical protein
MFCIFPFLKKEVVICQFSEVKESNEKLRMRRNNVKIFLYVVVSVLMVFAVLPANESGAYSNYGDDVNAYCQDSNPYTGSCLLCHTSVAKSDPTPATNAFLAGDLCYFCPTDTSCTGPTCLDADRDGYYAQVGCGTLVDCNDNDAAMNPAGTEICTDSKDNDCNGLIDQQDPACGTISCTDLDLDGFSVEGGDCGPVDCNDNNPFIFPGANDVCNDGIDQDCSGKDRTKGSGCRSAEGKGKTCSDRLDNDGDGKIDCADTDCSANRVCKHR